MTRRFNGASALVKLADGSGMKWLAYGDSLDGVNAGEVKNLTERGFTMSGDEAVTDDAADPLASVKAATAWLRDESPNADDTIAAAKTVADARVLLEAERAQPKPRKGVIQALEAVTSDDA